MRMKRVAEITMAAALSVSVFTACSKTVSETTAGSTEQTSEAKTETEETNDEGNGGVRDGKLVDPATVGFDNLSSDATADLFIEGTGADDFVPSDDYGYVVPYFGNRVPFGDNRLVGENYGFASLDGTVICEPVFDHFEMYSDQIYKDEQPYTFYKVGKDGKYGVISGTGSYYSGCEYDRIYMSSDFSQSLVILAGYDGDDIVNTVYDAVNNKVICEDVRYPAKYLPEDYTEPAEEGQIILDLRYVLDEDHIILGCSDNGMVDMYLYNTKDGTFFPDPETIADAWQDSGEIWLWHTTCWVEPMSDGVLLVKEGDGKETCYLMDLDGIVLTPKFESIHYIIPIGLAEVGRADWPSLNRYAVFSHDEQVEKAYVFNTKGEQVADLVTSKDSIIQWTPDDEYLVDIKLNEESDSIKMGRYSGEMEPLEEYEEILPDCLWAIESGDLYCVDMDYDNTYCTYEGTCAAFNIDPETADRDETFELFDRMKGCHFYVFENGELIFKSNSAGNDAFVDHVTGKHYVTFTEGTDDKGSSLIEMSTWANDYDQDPPLLETAPDNMIYCIEDKKLINLCIDSPFAQVIGITDSHLVLTNHIGDVGVSDDDLLYPLPEDKTAYTEIYDISDSDDPKLIFHYSATDAEAEW